jgi:glutamate/aspartate transport system substrate-binding protein
MRNAIHPGLAVLVAMAAATVSASTAAMDTLSRIRETQTIVIAYREGSLPFSFVDDKGQPAGYSVDFCLRIADAVKRELKLPSLKIRYLPVDSVTRFSALVEGKAALECGTTTNNAERRQRVSFTIAHFFSGVRMLVKTGSGIDNWPDLRNRTVVTTRSTTTVKLLNERNNVRALGIKLLEGADDLASFGMVDQGKADAFPMDDVLLYSLRATSKTPERFSIVGEPLSVEPYAIMLPKDDPAFKRLVDREMVRIINDGEFQRIYERWFLQPIGMNRVNLHMPMGRVLRDSLRFPSDQVAD